MESNVRFEFYIGNFLLGKVFLLKKTCSLANFYYKYTIKMLSENKNNNNIQSLSYRPFYCEIKMKYTIRWRVKVLKVDLTFCFLANILFAKYMI